MEPTTTGAQQLVSTEYVHVSFLRRYILAYTSRSVSEGRIALLHISPNLTDHVSKVGIIYV